MTTPRKQPTLPIASTVIVERTSALTALSKAATPTVVLKSLGARDVSPWYEADVVTLLEAVSKLDPAWVVRLTLITKPRHLGGEFGLKVVQAIARDSRARSSYPALPDDQGDAERLVRDWVVESVRRPKEPLPVAMVVSALWLDRRSRWFKDVAISLLQAWAVPSTSSRDDRVATIVRDLAVDRSGQRRASDIAMLLTQISDRRDRALVEAQQNAAAALMSRDARMRSETAHSEERSRFSDQIATLERAVDSGAETERHLTAELEALRSGALAERTRARTQLAQLRAKVLKVISHETEQLRLFLDRANPNVEDALSRLRYLEELRQQLDQKQEEVQ